jgi:hypothetical protein
MGVGGGMVLSARAPAAGAWTGVPAMNLRHALLAATIAFATPAMADVTYVGYLKGVVTSGSYTLNDPSGYCQCNGTVDLSGQPLSLNFTVKLFDSHVNAYGDPMSNYTEVSYSGSTGGYSFSGSSSNESLLYPYPFNLYETASFSGNAAAGTIASQSNSFYSDWGNAFGLTFSGGGLRSGAVTGSGNANWYDIYSWPERYFSANFNIVGGNVQAVPEPSTWALTILGFGMIGLAMRRRIKISRISYA